MPDEVLPVIASGPPPATDAASWQTLLRSPRPAEHIAQLYADRDFLVRAVGHFVAEGLRQGDAVVLLATPLNGRAILGRLEIAGFDPDARARRGQLTVMDAAPTLGGILVNGEPDAARFRALVGGAVSAARAAGYARVRAFGELVDLARRTSLVATLRLEALWDALLRKQPSLVLLCGYSIDSLDPSSYRGALQQVSALHSHLVPVEDYARLDRAVKRAYAEVFGAEHDAGVLHRMFLAHYARPAAMPDAQAAILAVREFVPSAAAALLDRVRHHYRASIPTAA